MANLTETQIEGLTNLLFELFKKDESEAVKFLKNSGTDVEKLDAENELFIKNLTKKIKWFMDLQDEAKKHKTYKNISNPDVDKWSFEDWEEYYDEGLTPLQALDEDLTYL